MEKIKKEKVRKSSAPQILIDGLPVLRGMFVCPESISRKRIPDSSSLASSGKMDTETNYLAQEERNWGVNWVGQD
jgi:hypothetical protein